MKLNVLCILFGLCFGMAFSTVQFLKEFQKHHQDVLLNQQEIQNRFIQQNLENAKKQQELVASSPTATSSSFQNAYQTSYAYRYNVVAQEYPSVVTTTTTNNNPNSYGTAVGQNPIVQNPYPTANAPALAAGGANINTRSVGDPNAAAHLPAANNGYGQAPVGVRSSFEPVTRVSVQNNPNESFGNNLFQALVPPAQASNIVYSPASLEMLLAFISTGAAGPTLQELQAALRVPNDPRSVAIAYQRILQSVKVGPDPKVVMANKVYHSPQLELQNGALQEFARDYFDSAIEPVNFASPNTAARKINQWVAEKTQNRIQNVIQPIAIDPRTEAILVNAIYFKARWEKPFSMSETREMDFHPTPQYSVPVSMMYNEEVFRYNDFPTLQASVIELPYENTDLSMLIILPFENATLGQVERNLQNLDLKTISDSLKKENVHVRIPRFNIDFEQDMTQTLQMLNIRHLFSDQADLSRFFKGRKPIATTKVQHKAHITVNEAGSEAAASSFASFVPLSLPARDVFFTADRPFMFAIRNPQAVFIMGHVVTF